MTLSAPAFDAFIAQPNLYAFTSSTESKITKLEINTLSRELRVFFASREEALSFCKENGFIADFFWLNFVTFEGSEIARIKALLSPFFLNDIIKNQFDFALNKLISSSR